MKKCSRCRKENRYLLLCLGLNKDKSKIVTLRLCSECITYKDLATKGCGHCDMKCSFEKYLCPNWLKEVSKIEDDLKDGIKDPDKMAFYNVVGTHLSEKKGDL